MLFNSFTFALFISGVFLLYWFIFNKNLKSQNLLILIASYIFYSAWDWRFLSLIIFSSTIDFFIGNLIFKSQSNRKREFYLGISILTNLGLLAYFKYTNFFIDSFIDLMNLLGFQGNHSSLNIILPVGISFYTFQTLSYTIDIYRKQLEPTKNIISFFAFVSFFPQLVAGPIERASRLLPQFYKARTFKYNFATDGMRQILWGLFKKVVIADTCAIFVDDIFTNYYDYNGSILLLGAIYFAVQIYCDFSGYSDIAIGVAKLFGFKLMQNFAFPYFSRDISEFWRRWHISLSTWFRDYLYIPLGGNRVKIKRRIFNILIVFSISGFWHGANWTFIMWGVIHGLYYIPLMVSGRQQKYKGSVIAQNTIFPSFKELFQMMITFLMVVIAWIFFRAENITDAFSYLWGIFNLSFFSIPSFGLSGLVYVFILFVIEWVSRKKNHPLQLLVQYPSWVRAPTYYILIITIIIYHGNQNAPFIYFQF